MRITSNLLNIKGVSVTYILDNKLDAKELDNVNPKNAFKVGAAIARRRLAKLGVVSVPVAVAY